MPELASSAASHGSSGDNVQTFPAGILRTVLLAMKPFLGDGDLKPCWETVQLFDARCPEYRAGNGWLFAANGIRSCAFWSKALEGKHLALGRGCLAPFARFLAKREGMVSVEQEGPLVVVSSSTGDRLTWLQHAARHKRFGIYKWDTDGLVLRVGKKSFTPVLREVRKRVRNDWTHVHVRYSLGVLTFGVGEFVGEPLDVSAGVGASASVAFEMSAGDLLAVLRGVRSQRPEFRVAVIPAIHRDHTWAALVRTVDDFFIDNDGRLARSGIACRAIRFAPARTVLGEPAIRPWGRDSGRLLVPRPETER